MVYVALMVLVVFASLFWNGVQMFTHSQLVKERDRLLNEKNDKGDF